MEPGQGDPAWVQVEPTELVLKPGQTVELHARLFDAAGRFLREEKSAAWSLDHLKGTVTDGKFEVAADPAGPSGIDQGHRGKPHRRGTRARDPAAALERDLRFLRGGQRCRRTGSARRPASFRWPNWTARRCSKRSPPIRCSSACASSWARPTGRTTRSQADIRIPEKRRQMGDAGITAQRYTLFAFGNNQRLEMNSWQPEVGAPRLGAVRTEARHLVPPEAARGEHGRRQNAHSRQSLGRRRSRAGCLAHRPHRSDPQQTRQSRPVRRRPVWSVFR